jgi:hypothetical protein
MSDTPIFEYRIYCVTDSRWEMYYGPTPPTTCPINSSHTVNPASVQNLRLIGPNTVVSQDSAPKGAPFQLKTIKMLIPATGVVPVSVIKNFSFPYDLYIWELSFSNIQINASDELSIGLGGDASIAGTTASVPAGGTIIPVSSTAFGYIVRGSEIGITNGVTSEHPGIVTTVDKVAGTITVNTALVNSYGAGSSILFTSYVVRNYVFSNTQDIILGRKGLQPRFVPAGTPIRIEYVDNTTNPSDYTLCFQLQYYHS